MKRLTMISILSALVLTAVAASAADVKLHSSRRYYQNAAGKPVFLVGYYTWASVAPGFFHDSPQRYVDMFEQAGRFRINYLRLSLGVNALGGKGDKYYEKDPTPTPFVYEQTGQPARAPTVTPGKVNLDKLNPVFWDGLKYHCDLAKKNGVILHICLFDGVDYRGGDQQHRWINSYWNVKNQVKDYYGNLDINGDGNADDNREFYRAQDFIANKGIGFYQRKLIDKALEVTKGYDNVFYEVGNELLGSRADWNAAVVDYVKSKSGKAITQCGGRVSWNAEGFSDHGPDTPADVKRMAEQYVGRGKPFLIDPDGSRLGGASPDDFRRSVWYTFAGGAAGWGGFHGDWWEETVSDDLSRYCQYMQDFIDQSGVRFWELTPHHDLVSNSQVNSCLAREGFEYVVYVLNDPTVKMNLQDVTLKAKCRIFDPKTGKWSAETIVDGGARRDFTKPDGADDWVIYIRAEG